MTAFHIRPYEHYCTEEILPLYEAVGWTNYTQRPDMLRDAFAGSRDVLAAYDGTQLVGILRAVGDGPFCMCRISWCSPVGSAEASAPP